MGGLRRPVAKLLLFFFFADFKTAYDAKNTNAKL